MKADLILHPVRMRILLELVATHRTASQLALRLPDVAQATLYRQLRTLTAAGMLVVVTERPIRGTVEKVYALVPDALRITEEDLQQADKGDHQRYFTAFITALLHDFARYLESTPTPDYPADGVTYRKGALYLSDAELQALQQALQALIRPLLGNPPTPDRRRRLLATVVLPVDEPADES